MASTVVVPTKQLPSGAEIPVVGFGAYLSDYAGVLSALRLGYRHIDTAEDYENEEDVGRAVRDSGIPREQIFITSKVFPTHWGYDAAVEACKRSNEKLGLGYIDLYLLHAPGKSATRAETWRALEDLQSQGLVKDIGVSNFSEAHLKKLAETWRVKPALNQIEVNPFVTRAELVAYCQSEGIHIEAYSPLAKSTKLVDPVVVEIAKETGVTPAQVLIAYSLAKDFITLPKSNNRERQLLNLEAVNVKLTPSQVERLDALDEYLVLSWDPIKNEPV
jgi:diketogulonate reductase-like aldo/keto reductase